MRVVLGRRVPCTWLLLFAPPWLKYSPRRGETGTLQGYLQLNPPTELLILVIIICISRKSDICMFPWFFVPWLFVPSVHLVSAVIHWMVSFYHLHRLNLAACWMLDFPVMRKVLSALRVEPGMQGMARLVN